MRNDLVATGYHFKGPIALRHSVSTALPNIYLHLYFIHPNVKCQTIFRLGVGTYVLQKILEGVSR